MEWWRDMYKVKYQRKNALYSQFIVHVYFMAGNVMDCRV